MKIALVCCGLDHIQRGFESFTRELFENYYDEEDVVHLYKGSGVRSSREIPLLNISRNNSLLKIFLIGKNAAYYRYKVEGFTFAISFLFYQLRNKYDIIHLSDNEFGKALLILKRLLGLKCKLLFSNGAPWPYKECEPYDKVQEVTMSMQKLNIDQGLTPSKSFYAPYGIDIKKYEKPLESQRNNLRIRYDIPKKAKIILSLSALKFEHKRLDWLIKEFSLLKDGYFLLLVGNEDDETHLVRSMAKKLLNPDSYHITTVAHRDIPYILSEADLLVSTSLNEAFGRVLLEAAAARVPILVHPHSAALEIIANTQCFVDMQEPESLCKAIMDLLDNESVIRQMTNSNFEHCQQKYSWKELNRLYKRMYLETLIIQDES